MKNRLLTIFSFTALILSLTVLNSCEEPVDLVTADAKSGGLVVVMTSSFPYKVGITTDIPLDMVVPKGAAITSIDIYKKFTRISDGKSSNEIVLTTVEIGSGNTSAELEKSAVANYASLSAGLTIDGVALPASAGQLAIGDSWVLTYVANLADGRKIYNSRKTTITLANPYAGSYTRTGVLLHQTAGALDYGPETIDLMTVDATTVSTIVGYFENPAYILTIKVNADYSVICGGNISTSVITNKAGEASTYTPATKTFTLNYFTITSGTRDYTETLVAE